MTKKISIHNAFKDFFISKLSNSRAITESENMNLRQAFQQIRNSDESFQYELFKIAQTKGYYKPAQKATTTEVQTVKTELQQ